MVAGAAFCSQTTSSVSIIQRAGPEPMIHPMFTLTAGYLLTGSYLSQSAVLSYCIVLYLQPVLNPASYHGPSIGGLLHCHKLSSGQRDMPLQAVPTPQGCNARCRVTPNKRKKERNNAKMRYKRF